MKRLRPMDTKLHIWFKEGRSGLELQAQTPQFRESVSPLARQLRERGLTLRAIAEELNQRHVKTCNDRVWYAASVGRLLKETGAPLSE